MCRSVPQMPVLSTRINTSLMPGSGTGTSSSHRPGFAWLLTRAFIEVGCPINCILPDRHVEDRGSVRGELTRRKLEQDQYIRYRFMVGDICEAPAKIGRTNRSKELYSWK